MAQQFTNRKLVVIGGSSGMGRQVAADVVAAGGSAVIVGRRQDRVEQAVAELSAAGTAWGIAADLRDPAELEQLQTRLACEHATPPCSSTPPACSDRCRFSSTPLPTTTASWDSTGPCS